MKRVHLEMTKMRVTAIAAGVALAMSLAACGGGGGDGDGDGGDNATPEFNAGVDKVYNPSDKKGGTLKMANDADFDSLDPGDTYYGYSWNFIRNYTRSLGAVKSEPGSKCNELLSRL